MRERKGERARDINKYSYRYKYIDINTGIYIYGHRVIYRETDI